MYCDKVKDMVRGILPSKARKTAKRVKKITNRQERCYVTAKLKHFSKNLEKNFEEEEPLDDTDLVLDLKTARIFYKHDIRLAKQERREADKVNPFLRWAVQKTLRYPTIREKYYNFVKLVGGKRNLILDHAIGHFIMPEYEFGYSELRDYIPSRLQQPSAKSNVDKQALIAKLEVAIDNGRQDRLNKLLGNSAKMMKACASDYTRGCWTDHKSEYIRTSWTMVNGVRNSTRFQQIYTDGMTRQEIEDYLSEKGVARYLVQYWFKRHDDSKCQNHSLRFDGAKSVRRIVRVLVARKQFSMLQELWLVASNKN